MAKRGRKPKHKMQKQVVISGIALLLILSSAISFLSLFSVVVLPTDTGYVNSVLDGLLRKLFGTSAFVIPVILFHFGLKFINTIKWKITKLNVSVGLILLMISIAGLTGNGVFGEILKQTISKYISSAGAIFLFITTGVFSIILVTNIGIDVFADKIGQVLDFIKNILWATFSQLNLFNIFHTKSGIEDINSGESQETSNLSKDVKSGYSISGVAETGDKQQFNDYSIPAIEESIDNQSKIEILDSPSEPVDQNMQTTKSEHNHKQKKKEHGLPYTNNVWEYPSIDIFNNKPNRPANAGNVQERARIIESTLNAFGIKASIADVHVGPAITQYALSLSIGTKSSKITNISTDLAMRLRSPSGSVRVVTPIPGTEYVGIEVPNFSPSMVSIRSVLSSNEYKKYRGKLKIVLGNDVAGNAVIQDIAKWPHALVAGATGSGKSVLLNSLICSLLYRYSPDQCKFIMIDPKFVELSPYNGIPHLLVPVVTDVEKKAVSALAWAVNEMERRYKLFAKTGVRDIASYNEKVGFQSEPYIIIIVDELADMMMVSSNEVEKYIIRLAQKSRATGIHLILATQRPSVNVLTGTIKANIPTRIAFKVTSQIDSRVVLDHGGAEMLIGRGDMLFTPPTDSKPRRIQGVFVHDKEINRLVDFLKESSVEPEYIEDVINQPVGTHNAKNGDNNDGGTDFERALEVICTAGKASISLLQRKMKIGYGRAAGIIDELEEAGAVGKSLGGSKARELLIATPADILNRKE